MARSNGKLQNYLTEVLVGAVLTGALLGTIMSQFNTLEQDTTNFSAAEIAIISVLGIVIVIGIMRYFLEKSKA
jgi:uncharacterized membrane protein YeaQ/YmgE (transglycosylase-associated protein family)